MNQSSISFWLFLDKGGRGGGLGYRGEWFYSRPPGEAFFHSSFVLGFIAIGMDFLGE